MPLFLNKVINHLEITVNRIILDISLTKKGIMKYTTVKISEIRQHPTMRLDARYWIKKKKKIKSNKRATSLTMVK